MRSTILGSFFALTILLGAPRVFADGSASARADAAIAKGDYAAAEKELSGSSEPSAALKLCELQLLRGRYEDVIATAKRIERRGKGARLATVPLRAQALARQGNLAEAIAALRQIEREPDARRARLVLGELLIQSGKRGEAQAPLMSIIDDYNDDRIAGTDAEGLSLVGRAAHLLRSARDANSAYNEAERVGAKARVESLLWRGELYLEKYDPAHAAQVVKEALKLAPKDPRARVAMARVKLESALDFDGAKSEIDQALEVNDRFPDAYAVRAGLALRDMEIAEADRAVDQGLKSNPTDLELLSMKAAIRFLADDPAGFEAAKRRVLAQNPEYSRLYQVVGEFAEWEHRYDDIVRMMQEAIRVDPNDARAYATLGMNLIRAGDEAAGLEALRKAWEKDKFNVRVFNTLNLLEKEVATEYVTVDGATFRVRYHKAERAVLERYVPRMLEEAWASMVKRYGFSPKKPVGIELYADSQHFSVRTSGLPNVGIQGVCFGQTLAAMSPGAAQFNWGNVLWHELAHVFAIQLSKNHVPRWFTEGLSEYETIVRRPEWQREEEPALYAALRAGRIPPVSGMNRAFTHVDSAEEVTMAYFAASQIVVFAAETFGFEKVAAMLPRWGAGERTPEVVQHALGISAEELDRRFRAWLLPRLERYRKQFVPDLHAPPLDVARKAALAAPSDAKKQVTLALALAQDGQMPEAEAVLAGALKLDPNQPDAHFLKVVWALGEKRTKEARAILEGMLKRGGDGYAVRMRLADLAEADKDERRLREHLEAAARWDPSQAEPIQALYDLAHKRKDKAGELAALRRLARLDQHDRRVWKRLLEALLERGAWEEARRVGESAIFVDVMNPEIHRLYARALARTGRFVSAVYELNSAVVCRPKPKELAAIYRELVTGYEKLGQPELAKRAQTLAATAEASARGN